MTHTSNFKRSILRGGTAFSALAMLGAGLAATTIIAPSVASAQDFTNVTAQGRVTDAAGNSISGATVTVTSNSQGFVNSATTGGDGIYRIPNLPQGSYTFEVSAPGFSSFRDENVVLTQSEAGNTFRLVAGDAAAADGEEILVRGVRVRVSDFDRTTTGAVIQVSDVATRVPVQRDLTSVILLAPGTSQGDTAFGNLAAVSGASVSENTFFLNGLNITDFRQGLAPVTVPFEFYDTVEVKNGGIPAEFGRFTGGFINAITRSGGNEFHGGVRFSWTPDELWEDSPDTLYAQNSSDTGQSLETVVYLSGPIWRDRIFFYGFYQLNNVESSDILYTGNGSAFDNRGTATPTDDVAIPPYSTGLRREIRHRSDPYWGGKIDIIPIDGHRLEFTYWDTTQDQTVDNYQIVDATGGTYDSRTDAGGPFTGRHTSTNLLTSGGENYVGRYTGQFTDWLTLSAAYGVNKRLAISGSTNNDYPFIGDTTGGGRTGNALNLIQDNQDEREFYRADVDLYLNMFGQHHFKAGYDRENLTSVALTRYTGGVAWVYNIAGAGDPFAPPGTFYVSGRTFINGGTFTSTNEAFYLQDAWSLFDNRLTLNLGVRADRFTNDNVAGEEYYNSGINWAPRIAFSLDPWGDGRTKIYGSYGVYYLPIVSNTNIRLAGAETDYTRYFVVAGVNPDNTPILGAPLLGFVGAGACPDTGVANCRNISDGTPTPTESTVAKNLRTQSVDEYVLGIERRIGSRIRVGLFGQYRKLNDSLEDSAIDAAVLAYCAANGYEMNNATHTGCADIWTGFHQYVLVNPGNPSTITLSDPLPGETTLRTIDFDVGPNGLDYPRAERIYKAITATFDRDFDGVWGLSASYTWSTLRGNAEGGVLSDIGQTDSGITQSFDQPGLTDGTYGFLPGHARHRFKIYGSLAITDWFTFGAQFQATSPRKFGCIGRVPNVEDPFAGAYGAAGFYCNVAGGEIQTDPTFPFVNSATATTLALTPRGTVFESDWNIFTNISLVFRAPTDAFDATFRVDVFNVFNQSGVIDRIEFGTLGNARPRGDFMFPTAYQSPRSFRFQLAVGF